MSKNVNAIISEFDLEKFRDCWAEFDHNVSFILKYLLGHRVH
jgi:hypothetical protein